MRFFIHSVANQKKIEGGALLVKIFFEKSHNAEKTERGDSLGFFNIRSVGKLQKIDPLGNFFFEKKSLTAPKKAVPFGPFEFLR